MTKLEQYILNEINTYGTYRFTTKYEKKNNRYKGLRTAKAAQKLEAEGLAYIFIEYNGLEKKYTVSPTRFE